MPTYGYCPGRTFTGTYGLALRTLAVAYRPLPTDELPEIDPSLEHDLVYLGIVGIIDPPRPEARAAIDEARRAGILVIMITRDHPRTAARIAEELGVHGPGASVITGSDLGFIGR